MKDELLWNKIFGAILATGLVILGLRQVSDLAFATKPVTKPGYVIAVQEAASDSGAAVADTPPDWGTVLPVADVAAGQTVSTKCASCHTFTNGGPNGTGPNNWGVIGRAPGSHAGFAYSQAMQDFGKKNAVWTYDLVYSFLANPQAYIAGTKMSFVGLKKPEDRINLIAWLRQQSSSPVAIPAPNPKAAAAAAPAAAAGGNVAAAADASAPAAVGGAAPSATTPSGATTGSPGAGAAPGADTTAPGGAPK